MRSATDDVKENLRYRAASHIIILMTLIDTAEMGRKGGKARAANLSEKELSASASEASRARWKAYYAKHPDKLKAKLAREAKKGTVPRGRPKKKSAKKGQASK
jgi:hypothetical protein